MTVSSDSNSKYDVFKSVSETSDNTSAFGGTIPSLGKLYMFA